MRSSEATGPRSFAPRPTRRSRMRTRNVGSAPYDASSATAPSSGTSDNSNGSWTSTSSTTTATDRIGRSDNAHPTMPTSSSIGPTDRSDDTPPATDSSTSTAKQPDPPPQRPTHHDYIRFSAPAPPTTDPDVNINDAHRTPERVSGTHKIPYVSKEAKVRKHSHWLH